MIDLRTREGRARKAELLADAESLRRRGWTIKDIAALLGASSMTVSMWLPQHLRCLSDWELEDRRGAVEEGRDPDLETDRLRAEIRAEREEERRAEDAARALVRAEREEERKRKRRERERAQAKAREARQAVRRRKQAQSRVRRSIHSPWSLDAPLQLAELGGTYADITPDNRPSADPFNVIRSEEFDAIVGDLTAEDVLRLNDDALRVLRSRLLEAGFAPGSVQQKERDRLRTPAPHRGLGRAA